MIFRRIFELTNTLYRHKLLRHLHDFTVLDDNYAHYHYTCNQADLAEIRKEFSYVYPLINRLYHFTPPQKASLIIYKDPLQMQNIIHSPIKQLPMGIYWLGQIHILAPSAWLDGDEQEKKCAFQLFGPIAHEYTHYIIDYATYGNYPKWFSEGLAQYTEQLLAKLPPYSTSCFLSNDYYALEEIEYHFDLLPNQQLVYLESFLAVLIILENFSFDFVRQLLDLLKYGDNLMAILTHKNLNYPTFNLLLQAKLKNIRKIFAQSMPENG